MSSQLLKQNNKQDISLLKGSLLIAQTVKKKSGQKLHMNLWLGDLGTARTVGQGWRMLMSEFGKWIPVTEETSPEVDRDVLITCEWRRDNGKPKRYVEIDRWTGVINKGVFDFENQGPAITVVAWMPLPEPLGEDKDDNDRL